MRKNEKITALYERLSRDDFGKDDDQQRESNSISNQKAMLEEFAARQGFTNIVHFTDDGISGTCFDRPGFLAMMKEVEAGNVEYLCIKDMSRLGRDYLKVGQIMEILRQRGVRLIAINDGVDSARGDDDFTPFRNIMNEYYARDTSRKIRSTFQSKGKSGKHLTGTVIYGYGRWYPAAYLLRGAGYKIGPPHQGGPDGYEIALFLRNTGFDASRRTHGVSCRLHQESRTHLVHSAARMLETPVSPASAPSLRN